MTTRQKGATEEERALSPYVKLVRATISLNVCIHRRLRDHGLTESRFGALEANFHLK